VDLELNETQRMLAEVVGSLLDKRYDSSARLRLLLHDDLGWSPEMWSRYADLGLLGLTIRDAYGGAGMGITELSVVMEAFGRALVLEPFFATVVLGAALVSAVGSPEQKLQILPGVAAGTTLLAFAYAEPGSRWSRSDISALAVPAAGQWRISGTKTAVLGGDVADQFLVTARTPEGQVGLFVADAGDVRREGYRMQDGLGGADLVLEDTPAAAVGAGGDALEVIESTLDTATVALCAEAVGAMERMVWLTVGYLKTRVQFGAPISNLQALQFRAADMYLAYEQARSMALLARIALADEDVVERRRVVSAAKVQIDVSGQKVSQEAIQLHGAIGMAMEYAVGHYLKRLAVIAKTFADKSTMLEVVAAGDGLIKPRVGH
jgi:alkylation response protein AidB-like acyl-CoA dehydrogenase